MVLRGLSTVATACLVAVLCGAPVAAEDSPLAGLDAYVQDAMKQWRVPGLAVGVVKDDEVVFARGFGVRRLGGNEAVDENTVFAIGSNTKAFTATALGVLVQEGEIRWDDRAIDHLDGFRLHDPYTTAELTIRDMLSHRSGYATWAGDLVWYGSDYTRDEVLHRLRHLEPATSLRSRFGYSNFMFLAAGQVIPSVTGRSWDDFIRHRLFHPLGMTRSTTSVRELEGMDNVASPHTEVEGRVIVIPYRNIDNCAPAGAINSSVIDMTRWLRLQLNTGTLEGERIIDEAVIRATHTPQTPVGGYPLRPAPFDDGHFVAYGLGWVLHDHRGRLMVSHTGGIDGMLSDMGLLPEERLAVVVLSNCDAHRLSTALYQHIVDSCLGTREHDWSAWHFERAQQSKAGVAAEAGIEVSETLEPRLSSDAYTGTFTNSLYGEARVELIDGELRIDLLAHESLESALVHRALDTFVAKWKDPFMGVSEVSFTVDDSGAVSGFRVKVREDFIDPLEYVFERDPR
jgi:CubicO group peptidase (beta-lactamase class C family)